MAVATTIAILGPNLHLLSGTSRFLACLCRLVLSPTAASNRDCEHIHPHSHAAMKRSTFHTVIMLLTLIPLAGCSARTVEVIPVPHSGVTGYDVPTIRLEPGRDVWVRIGDANTLIYDYVPTGTAIRSDDEARSALNKLLGTPPVTAQAVEELLGADPAGVRADPFRVLAVSTINTGNELLSLIFATDAADQSPEEIKATVAAELAQIADGPLAPYLSSAESLEAELRNRYADAPPEGGSRPSTDEALFERALQVAPAVVRFAREMRAFRLGEVPVRYEYADGDAIRLELTIANRFEGLYEPQRITGTGIDVAVIQPAFSPIEFTFGLSAVFGDQTKFALETLPLSEEGAVQRYKVNEDTVDDFGLSPTAMVTLLTPIHIGKDLTPTNTPFAIGLSFGVGMSGSDLAQLDETVDLSLGITGGFDWLRLSFGAANVSRIASLNGLGDDKITTDPNILNAAERERGWAPFVSLHVRP